MERRSEMRRKVFVWKIYWHSTERS